MVSSPQFLANLVFLLYVLFLLLSFSFSLSLFSLFLLLFLKYSSKSAILSFSRIARISFLTISISMALNFHKCRTIDGSSSCWVIRFGCNGTFIRILLGGKPVVKLRQSSIFFFNARGSNRSTVKRHRDLRDNRASTTYHYRLLTVSCISVSFSSQPCHPRITRVARKLSRAVLSRLLLDRSIRW